jgi:BolA protein|tara:strand:+ start:2043 stop:2354 length:312 start_codon:yes stop_codon:yes gene_type:complete
MIKEDIENNLKDSLDVSFLEVINESNMHNVPDGAESHFKITVVSNVFEQLRPVQRHQKIYEILKTEMKKIHAIAIHPYTNDEWKDISGEDLTSPNCLGGENAE